MTDKKTQGSLPKEETAKIRRSADTAKVDPPASATEKLLANHKNSQTQQKQDGSEK